MKRKKKNTKPHTVADYVSALRILKAEMEALKVQQNSDATNATIEGVGTVTGTITPSTYEWFTIFPKPNPMNQDIRFKINYS